MTDLSEAYKTSIISSKYPLQVNVATNATLKQYNNIKNLDSIDVNIPSNSNTTSFSNVVKDEYETSDDVQIFSEWKPKSQYKLEYEESHPNQRASMKPMQHCISRSDATLVCPTRSEVIEGKTIKPFQDCSDKIQTKVAKLFFQQYKRQYFTIGIKNELRLKYYLNNLFIGGNVLLVAFKENDQLYGTVAVDTKNPSRVHLSHLYTSDSDILQGFRILIHSAEQYLKKFQMYTNIYLFANRNELQRNQQLGFTYETEEQTHLGWRILMKKEVKC